jgi:phytol kinase
MITESAWVGMAVAAVALAGGGALLHTISGAQGWNAETRRKAVHVWTGLVCLTFPLLFRAAWPVWVLAGGALSLLLVVRGVPVLRAGAGASLHGVKRVSYGELLFAPAVALVFTGSLGRAELFVIPVLILTAADAAAALAGTRWGTHVYGARSGWKSVQGSAAFAAVAALSAWVPLVFGWGVDAVRAGLIAGSLALVAMMIEGIADRGFDNLTIPLVTHVLLRRLLESSAAELGVCFTVAAGLLAVVIAARRSTTLDGGAMLGVALLGFMAGVVGGLPFLGPLLGVFAAHVLATRQHALTLTVSHGMDAVLGIAIVAVPWVLAREPLGVGLAVAGLGCGMQCKLTLMHLSTARFVGTIPGAWVVVRGAVVGLVFGMLPAMPWAAEETRVAMLGMGTALSLLAGAAYARVLRPRAILPPLVFLMEGVAALALSVTAWEMVRGLWMR